jgi:hypothetical protein
MFASPGRDGKDGRSVGDSKIVSYARESPKEATAMAKGQQKPKTNNKPKLTTKEKKQKKKKKMEARST